MLRKTVCVLVAVAILCMLPTPFAAAAPDAPVGLAQAIDAARAAFAMPADLKTFDYSFTMMGENDPVWKMTWRNQDSSENLSVTVSALSGVVVGMDSWGPWESTLPGIPQYGVFPKLDAAAALRIAARSAEDLAGTDRFVQTRLKEEPGPLANLSPDSWPHQYTITFERRANDIPFPENYIRVGINGETGEVNNYALAWDDNLAFPAPERYLGTVDAQKVMVEKGKLDLQYWRPYPGGVRARGEDARLIYRLDGTDWAVDALSGEFFLRSQAEGLMNKSWAGDARGPEQGAYSPEVLSEIEQNSTLVNQEEALRTAATVLGGVDGFTLQNATLERNGLYPNQIAWQFSWEKTDQEKGDYDWRNASIDASTGEVISFGRAYKWMYSVPTEQQPSLVAWSDGLEIARKYLETHESARLAQCESITEESQDQVESQVVGYQFERRVNGIPYPEDSLIVDVDRTTGAVVGFTRIWGDIGFAINENTKAPAAVYEGIFTTFPLELVYGRGYVGEKAADADMPIPTPAKGTPVRLVWRMAAVRSAVYSALTGDPLNYEGEVMEPEYKAPKDLPTAWAQSFAAQDAALAAEIGLWRPGEELPEPGSNLTHGELSRFLLRLCGINPGSVTPADMARVQNGYFCDADISAEIPVTRVEMAQVVTRYLGLAKAAADGDIFALPFADVGGLTSAERGAIGVVYGLRVMVGGGGVFGPGQPITAEQALLVIVRVLRQK